MCLELSATPNAFPYDRPSCVSDVVDSHAQARKAMQGYDGAGSSLQGIRDEAQPPSLPYARSATDPYKTPLDPLDIWQTEAQTFESSTKTARCTLNSLTSLCEALHHPPKLAMAFSNNSMKSRVRSSSTLTPQWSQPFAKLILSCT